MAKLNIPTDVREAVILRASKCCEYCKSQDKYSPTAFTIDHVVPESLDGTSAFENLAYACFLCNRLILLWHFRISINIIFSFLVSYI